MERGMRSTAIPQGPARRRRKQAREWTRQEEHDTDIYLSLLFYWHDVYYYRSNLPLCFSFWLAFRAVSFSVCFCFVLSLQLLFLLIWYVKMRNLLYWPTKPARPNWYRYETNPASRNTCFLCIYVVSSKTFSRALNKLSLSLSLELLCAYYDQIMIFNFFCTYYDQIKNFFFNVI